MTKSDLFPLLNDITFAEKQPEIIERDLINYYENITKRTLARGDPVRKFIETITYEIVLLRSKIDYIGKMNLLAYASGDYLDHLGALLEVQRLEAAKAVTTLQFTLSEKQTDAVIIPEGTRATPDGNILFTTTETITINAGEISASVKAECTQAGEMGNGFLPGQIKKLVDPFPYEMKVENISVSYGGSDIESDENFRERIQIAPESFSVAGPVGAYKYYTMSANSSIIDVAVVGPAEAERVAPGNVYIYPLLIGGEIPGGEILQEVYENCNAEDVRPDTDYLHVEAPEVVNYDLQVTYWIDSARATQATQIQSAVNQAVTNWITWQKSKLGRDINPSELNHRMVAAGAKRVEIALPSFTALDAWEVAINTTHSVTLGGFENG